MTSTTAQTSYAPVNGLNVYYEIHGSGGHPLVLLHGGLGTIDAMFGQLLREDYDWSRDVAAMRAPALIVVGDADSVRPSHAVELFGLLGGGKVDGAMGGMPHSRLAVFPDTTHFTTLTRTDLLLPITTAFLDAPMPDAK